MTNGAMGKRSSREPLVMGRCELYCGDTSIVLQALPSQTVDVVITSPPYFRQRDYGVLGQMGQERSLDDYLSRLGEVLAELRRVVKDNGSCFIVIGDTYHRGSLQLVPHRVAVLASDLGWVIRNDIIWHKLDPAPGRVYGRWRNAHEHVVFLTRKAAGYYFNLDEIREPYSDATLKRWGKGQKYGGPKSEHRQPSNGPRMRHGRSFQLDERGCVQNDIWQYACPNERRAHYAVFPMKLVQKLVAACCPKGGTILDPFVGTGTTCVAAVTAGRNAIGIELSQEYMAMAKEAIELVSPGATVLRVLPEAGRAT